MNILQKILTGARHDKSSTIDSASIAGIPTLDTVVLQSLEFFATAELPELNPVSFERPLVMGSVNAGIVGQLLFRGSDATYATVDTYETALEQTERFGEVVVVSASGAKHAVDMVQLAVAKGLKTTLITNTKDSPAGELLPETQVRVFPKIDEPYTYNTSTYLGMLLAVESADPVMLRKYIADSVSAIIPDTLATNYTSFCILLPSALAPIRDMVRTKFDELFGPMVQGRVFTFEEAKHAKTVVSSPEECFISIGIENNILGDPAQRVYVPLPNTQAAAGIAVAYYVVGCLQRQFPPYFAENIAAYAEHASAMFGHKITPIVTA